MKEDIEKFKDRRLKAMYIEVIFMIVYFLFRESAVNMHFFGDYDDHYIRISLLYIFLMFSYSSMSLFLIQNFCFKKFYNSNDQSLEGKFIAFEKAYFYVWLIISLLYFIIIFIFNFEVPFVKGKKGVLSIIGWSGTVFYAMSSFYLSIDSYMFCKDILSYKRYSMIFSKFTRSILTAISSWLIITVFIYNSSNNKVIPIKFSIFYIALSIAIAFLYPLIDLYQYTFEELEKHRKELEKLKKEQYKYNHYNYK